MTNEKAIKQLKAILSDYRDDMRDTPSLVKDDVDALRYAITALERDRWISVEEAPKRDGWYLVLYESHRMDVRYHIAGRDMHRPVIAWRELPEPPKEETL